MNVIKIQKCKNIITNFLVIAVSIILLLNDIIINVAYSNVSNPTFSFDKNNISVSKGKEFTFTLQSSNIKDMYAYEITLEYSSDIIELSGIKSLMEGFDIVPKLENNKIIYACTKTGNNTSEKGDVKICNITFKGKAEGSGSITLIKVKILDSNLKEEVYNPNLKLNVSITSEQMTSSTSSAGSSSTKLSESQAPSTLQSGKSKEDTRSESLQVNLGEKGNIKISASIKLTDKIEAKIDNNTIEKAFESTELFNKGKKIINIEFPKAEGVKEYLLQIPSKVISTKEEEKFLKVITQKVEVVLPSDMLAPYKLSENDVIGIKIAQLTPSEFTKLIKDNAEIRDVISIDVIKNDKIIKWANEDAPVEVFVNYTPSIEELKELEYITVWYVDGKGDVKPISSSKYDITKKGVVFTTTHFSSFSIVFGKKMYKDLKGFEWAKKAIESMGIRDIVDGIKEDLFMPGKNIKRGEYVGWLIKALGLSCSFKSNFTDVPVDSPYYKEIGIAKAYGIAKGIGNNRFNPEGFLTRQDMMVLAVRALKAANKVLPKGEIKDITTFEDGYKLSNYAVEDVAALIKSGLIKGDGKKLNPSKLATRAEAAVFIYRIYFY